VTPGERAAAAVKANPEKSDRVIADELGVGNATVSRARRRSATVSDDTVEKKRVGKDGKTRRQPQRKTSPDKLKAALQSRQQGATQDEAAKSAGLKSVQPVKMAEAYEQGRVELLEELGVDPETLSLTAQAKLRVAKERLERQLRAEHAARLRGVDEEVRLRVVAEGKDYLARIKEREAEANKTKKLYREWFNQGKKVLTIDEFNLVRSCLHPDTRKSLTPEKLESAFVVFNAKKFLLTGER
jgi:hypothetical protein